MNLKLAFVKSSIYTDLWVNDITNDYFTLFKTSFMRCPAIGLAENYETDFIIVKESGEYPCQSIIYPWETSHKNNIQYAATNKNPGLPFLDETYHKDVTVNNISHDVDTIDWSKYNIVITINACIPQRIIDKYPQILWCYYVSENDEQMVNQIIGNYDLILNQDVNKPNLPPFSIGFPYTFLGPNTIENINKKHLHTPLEKKTGIFMEINNTTERPVVNIPPGFMEISEKTSMPIIRHDQNIIQNTTNLYSAKYYVKLYGRIIRGNSVLESISAGTLTLINKGLTMYPDLIPDACHVETTDDVIEKIKYFEENPDEYASAIGKQKELLRNLYYVKPMKDLFRKYFEKNKKFTSCVMTLREWQCTVKPLSEIIYNCSVQDGSDGWLPFTIGIGWSYIRLKNYPVKHFQIGSHENLVSCTICEGTDGRRRPSGSSINRQKIVGTLRGNNIHNRSLDSQVYFLELPSYKFIISPEGNGIDCHRHYEALLAGCIPIVEHNDLIEGKYKNCPILYTTDYTEITHEYLQKKYEEMLDKVYDFSALMLSCHSPETQAMIKSNGNYWSSRLTGMNWYE